MYSAFALLVFYRYWLGPCAVAVTSTSKNYLHDPVHHNLNLNRMTSDHSTNTHRRDGLHRSPPSPPCLSSRFKPSKTNHLFNARHRSSQPRRQPHRCHPPLLLLNTHGPAMSRPLEPYTLYFHHPLRHRSRSAKHLLRVAAKRPNSPRVYRRSIGTPTGSPRGPERETSRVRRAHRSVDLVGRRIRRV